MSGVRSKVKSVQGAAETLALQSLTASSGQVKKKAEYLETQCAYNCGQFQSVWHGVEIKIMKVNEIKMKSSPIIWCCRRTLQGPVMGIQPCRSTDAHKWLCIHP